jgi:KipI family sensor histidine kinase inhibitor
VNSVRRLNSVRIVAAGDAAILVEFEDRIDPVVNRTVMAVADAIQKAAVPGVRDIVPTFRSVAIHFDPLRTDYEALVARVTAYTGAGSPYSTETRAPYGEPAPISTETRPPYGDPAPVRVPVCYTHEFGPDLTDVAAFGRINEAEVVRLHTSRIYRVFMLGFVAGFAYMGTVDERIAAPRLSIPRIRVPAGSVGIADVQTGIYPGSSPGGWRIIGRTPLKPFDLARQDPFLFKPADAVQFYAIQPAEYARLENAC